MQCPFCGGDNDKVIDSRGSDGGRSVRRRRQCLACNRRFTTYERFEETTRITVVKKDGSRVSYDRQRLLAGLQKACYKRPVSDPQLLRIVETVEENIFRNYEKDVPSSFIGDTASDCLRKLDKVAYIRFASVYREFKDVGELIEEASAIRDVPEEAPGQKDLFDANNQDSQHKAGK
ncbi:MAG: transcriptional repressor NrdR [Phycisphaerae bacterium]|nr:transcriptional repressor NrdR [Phycisphaerae bacterium]